MSDSPNTNLPEQTVSELSNALKRTIETVYDHVRVRGELGRVTIARSGHMYADIKDDKAVLSTVMWKGQVSRLPFRPEEGLEVVATGRLSTYPGRSNYQLIASEMRPAGAGALMALLEERKKKLAAEGLFDERHKKRLPYLPNIVGVVTSPTGAVIRDILHRISDRFATTVILWPALVQGDSAAPQIERAIRGFNAMTGPERPDVLIVGRGGGSIEDLWPFNEENVVRAAFESQIPLISAVGHETDTTLIDYVADARAPTPTGAAEIAVPVRAELQLSLDELMQRHKRALSRHVRREQERVANARLPRPERLLETKRQALDFATTRLPRAVEILLHKLDARLNAAMSRLRSPEQVLNQRRANLLTLSGRLTAGLQQSADRKRIDYTKTAARLRPEPIRSDIQRSRKSLRVTSVRARPALLRIFDDKARALESETKLLETLSYQATLKRGYALVRTGSGQLVRDRQTAGQQAAMTITFADGDVNVTPTGKAPTAQKKTASLKPAISKKPDQGSLF
ncbi:MAG: exodeoxyribonuclease VII large subunit [Alphaproteobacteria bacterium]|nr:exodeoxyribonuclease VII large subunit [Alphaproteobacteria bacterium]